MKQNTLVLTFALISTLITSCSFSGGSSSSRTEAPQLKSSSVNTLQQAPIEQTRTEPFHFAGRAHRLRADAPGLAGLFIETQSIEYRKLPISIILKGQVEPASGKEVDVSTRILGKVVQVMVHNGEPVVPGQVLAILDSQEISELAAEVIEAKSKLQMARSQKDREHQILEEAILIPKGLIESKARLDETKTQKELTDSEYEREEGLLKEKIAAKKEYLAAKAAQARAHTAYEVAKLEWHHEKHLYESQALMRKDYQLAESEFIRASQHLDTLKQRLFFLGMDPKAIEALLQTGKISGTVTITAPQAGIINHEDVAAGEVVHTDDCIFKIVDLTNVVAKAGLPENDLSLVSVGTKVRITAASYPDLVFTGTIDHISEQVNKDNKTVTVTAKLSNTEGRLKINMSIDLVLEPEKTILACPKSALITVNDEKAVFIAKQKTYELRLVKTGIESMEFIQIHHGLTQDDKVVTRGPVALATILEKKQND